MIFVSAIPDGARDGLSMLNLQHSKYQPVEIVALDGQLHLAFWQL
jgi:hypothetical protein